MNETSKIRVMVIEDHLMVRQGIVALLILAVGLGEFLYFEPPGQSTSLRATIAGVYLYDRTADSTSGPDREPCSSRLSIYGRTRPGSASTSRAVLCPTPPPMPGVSASKSG